MGALRRIPQASTHTRGRNVPAFLFTWCLVFNMRNIATLVFLVLAAASTHTLILLFSGPGLFIMHVPVHNGEAVPRIISHLSHSACHHIISCILLHCIHDLALYRHYGSLVDKPLSFTTIYALKDSHITIESSRPRFKDSSLSRSANSHSGSMETQH
jgi:hypothetical protein